MAPEADRCARGRARRRVRGRFGGRILSLPFRIALLALLALAATPPPPAEAGEPTVILLSLDGVRHDQPDRAELEGLGRMARDGARADALVPVFPSSTFTNHVSLATGTYADVHGIVGNRFLDPEEGEFDYDNDASFLLAEPLWAAAERQGVRAAAFFWVGSETPWHGVAASYRKTPFDSGVGEAEKVAQILAWLDLPAAERPRLIVSWWHGTDHVGHEDGPDSEDVVAQLMRQDRQLARLIEALDERAAFDDTTLLVVSDHGMVPVATVIDARAALEKAGVKGRVFHASGMANVYLEGEGQVERAVEVLRGLDLDAWQREELPVQLRYTHPRAGDVVALARPGQAILSSWAGLGLRHRAVSLTGGTVGVHGYDPASTDDVHGIFFALGRGVAPGQRFGEVRTIDVAASVAALLGIEPPSSNEGKPLPFDLSPPPPPSARR